MTREMRDELRILAAVYPYSVPVGGIGGMPWGVAHELARAGLVHLWPVWGTATLTRQGRMTMGVFCG